MPSKKNNSTYETYKSVFSFSNIQGSPHGKNLHYLYTNKSVYGSTKLFFTQIYKSCHIAQDHQIYTSKYVLFSTKVFLTQICQSYKKAGKRILYIDKQMCFFFNKVVSYLNI